MKGLILVFLLPICAFSQYECDDNIYDDTTYTGVCEEYYEDGNVHFRTSYLNDEKHGTYQEFYYNGDLKAEATYAHWQIQGEAKRYYSNGKVELIMVVDSLGNGTVNRFHENEKIQRVGQFKLGFREGVWIQYDNQGNIIAKDKKTELLWLLNKQTEADINKDNDDPTDDFSVDWSWTTEDEFYKNEEWYD